MQGCVLWAAGAGRVGRALGLLARRPVCRSARQACIQAPALAVRWVRAGCMQYLGAGELQAECSKMAPPVQCRAGIPAELVELQTECSSGIAAECNNGLALFQQ